MGLITSRMVLLTLLHIKRRPSPLIGLTVVLVWEPARGRLPQPSLLLTVNRRASFHLQPNRFFLSEKAPVDGLRVEAQACHEMSGNTSTAGISS